VILVFQTGAVKDIAGFKAAIAPYVSETWDWAHNTGAVKIRLDVNDQFVDAVKETAAEYGAILLNTEVDNGTKNYLDPDQAKANLLVRLLGEFQEECRDTYQRISGQPLNKSITGQEQLQAAFDPLQVPLDYIEDEFWDNLDQATLSKLAGYGYTKDTFFTALHSAKKVPISEVFNQKSMPKESTDTQSALPGIPQEDPNQHLDSDMSDQVLDLYAQYKKTGDASLLQKAQELSKRHYGERQSTRQLDRRLAHRVLANKSRRMNRSTLQGTIAFRKAAGFIDNGDGTGEYHSQGTVHKMETKNENLLNPDMEASDRKQKLRVFFRKWEKFLPDEDKPLVGPLLGAFAMDDLDSVRDYFSRFCSSDIQDEIRNEVPWFLDVIMGQPDSRSATRKQSMKLSNRSAQVAAQTHPQAFDRSTSQNSDDVLQTAEDPNTPSDVLVELAKTEHSYLTIEAILKNPNASEEVRSIIRNRLQRSKVSPEALSPLQDLIDNTTRWAKTSTQKSMKLSARQAQVAAQNPPAQNPANSATASQPPKSTPPPGKKWIFDMTSNSWVLAAV